MEIIMFALFATLYAAAFGYMVSEAWNYFKPY